MFEIKWTPEAETLYFETLEYWINHNKSNAYALKIIDEVERKEKLLAGNPFSENYWRKRRSKTCFGLGKFFYSLQNSENNNRNRLFLGKQKRFTILNP